MRILGRASVRAEVSPPPETSLRCPGAQYVDFKRLSCDFATVSWLGHLGAQSCGLRAHKRCWSPLQVQEQLQRFIAAMEALVEKHKAAAGYPDLPLSIY